MSVSTRVPSAGELADARRFVPTASPAEVEAFAVRQAEALLRVAALDRFYRAHDCRMARLHRLGSAEVVLCRFAGASVAFARSGELIQPVDADGSPRGPRWELYARACRAGRALDVRDELWMAAHTVDMAELRRAGVEVLFEEEAARHPGHPMWELMRRHLAFTLGARRHDGAALAGEIALETAMAHALRHSLVAMVREGGTTFVHTFTTGVRALLSGASAGPGLPSYRSIALLVLRGTVVALALISVWRKGRREALRGEASTPGGWPILAQTLGARVADVHPAVVGFYENPARYDLRCTLELHTTLAHVWSRLLTSIAGQGLYEAGTRTYEARIRTYRRADGAMHFVREVDTGRALRVFDSDFVVRDHRGVPTLFERFPEVHLEYELFVTPLGPGLGVSIRGRDLYWRGIRVPTMGLEVEFRSFVVGEGLKLEGVLAQRPNTAIGRFFVRRVLRRPEILGCIRYVAVREGGGELGFLG
jgi:hypothetical protein